MKNYEEIAKDVFEKRDEYNAQRARRSKTVKRLTVTLSCFCVAILAGVGLMLGGAFEQDEPKETTPTVDDSGRLIWVDDRERNGINASTGESARLWRWDEKTELEKYQSLKFDGKEYRTRGREISASLLGEKLGKGKAEGYDDYAILDPIKTERFDVYEIKGISSELLVALHFDKTGEYCVFMKEEYDPPKALGELISAYSLTENLPLDTFYYYKNGNSEGKFALSDEGSAHIWEILQSCSDAGFIESPEYSKAERVGFSATSEALGIKNLSFSVSEDGYISTNIMSYGYYFNIGRDAAKEIIDYAKDNGTSIAEERQKTIVGTVVEIGDDYLKVDDSIMMKDPNDGVVFTINAEALKIKRYLSSLSVGEKVVVEYEGYIYADAPTTVEHPVSICECYISGDGDVLIPE